ncbi:MAG: S-layer homology domain-containing protein [Clostridiales bacterium]|nr:S-layer homology domain-containing protein [Clostridiales bacterium]
MKTKLTKRIISAALTASIAVLGSAQVSAVKIYDDIENLQYELCTFVTGSRYYDDVSEDDWFDTDIGHVSDNFRGLMIGKGERIFAPNDKLTRAEFATIMYRLEHGAASSAEKSAASDFPDVEKDSWYSGYVVWAEKNGIVKGYPESTGGVYYPAHFAPDGAIRRSHIALMIYRYLVNREITLPDVDDPAAPFDSPHDIDPYMTDEERKAIDALRLAGIVRGNEHGYFEPYETATRAEVAAMIVRLDDAINYKLDVDFNASDVAKVTVECSGTEEGRIEVTDRSDIEKITSAFKSVTPDTIIESHTSILFPMGIKYTFESASGDVLLDIRVSTAYGKAYIYESCGRALRVNFALNPIDGTNVKFTYITV